MTDLIPFVSDVYKSRTMEARIIHVPVGPALVAVGKNIIKTGQSIYINVPSTTTWKLVTDKASSAFGTIRHEFDLGSQPRADPHRPLRQQALAWANRSSSSQPEELLGGLPVRVWEGVRAPRVPPKKENAPPAKLKESARTHENSPSPYAFTIRAKITESTLPAVTAAVRLTGIDGDLQDPEDNFDAVEMIWDTGAHETVISEDLLSSDFRNYLKNPIHDPYRNETGVKVQIDGELCFSNTILQINCVCLVVPSSVMRNERLGILLGQEGAIDRIIYKSVPRANLNARGEALPPTLWGDIVVDEYIDLFDEIHKF